MAEVTWSNRTLNLRLQRALKLTPAPIVGPKQAHPFYPSIQPVIEMTPYLGGRLQLTELAGVDPLATGWYAIMGPQTTRLDCHRRVLYFWCERSLGATLTWTRIGIMHTGSIKAYFLAQASASSIYLPTTHRPIHLPQESSFGVYADAYNAGDKLTAYALWHYEPDFEDAAE